MFAHTIVGTTVLPRRLTQLFADTKKSYENVVQTQYDGPELSALHLKLRIQKDRLIAWGIQWSDRSAAPQAGDIDGSLDRAGISDLVASIMCSIRQLLDEAEALQPQILEVPVIFSDLKSYGKSVATEPVWTTSSLSRLEGILRDLTTSIDTLCDLSRPRVEEQYRNESVGKGDVKKAPAVSVPSHSDLAARTLSPSPSLPRETLFRADDLAKSCKIGSNCFRLKLPTAPSRLSMPPSYESIAAGSENRSVAYLSPRSSQREIGTQTVDTDPGFPVLLDYGPSRTNVEAQDVCPDAVRFEELYLALTRLPVESSRSHWGILRLKGWTVDKVKTRCAYVYEIPRAQNEHHSLFDNLQPRSLLSFLQNGGDTDTNNMPCLENRFRLAANIASSIKHLHAVGITHRNVNSNNVVFFVNSDTMARDEKVWKGSLIRRPYLTAFHQSTSGISISGSELVVSGIYQHPSLGNNPSSPYFLAHDYYSLGLILLEIGLWMPIGKFWKSKYTRHDFRSRLQDIYLKKLSAKCGDGYMSAVLYCMTAADEALSDGGRLQLQRETGDFFLTEFCRHVLEPLHRCCSIDSDGNWKAAISTVVVSSVPEQSRAEQATTQKQGESPAPAPLDMNQPAICERPEALPSGYHATLDTKELPKAKRTIKVWSHDLPSLYLKYWTTTMLPKLERILRRAISRWESYTVDLFLAGEDPDTARPTVYMECESTGKVRKILQHLNKELRLFEIKVVPGQIVWSKAGKKKRKHGQKKQSTTSGSSSADHSSFNPHYQQRPGCGASIGAFRNGYHLPAVSFGGAVLVNGEPFGMSVHHMLEDDGALDSGLADTIGLQRSMAPPSDSSCTTRTAPVVFPRSDDHRLYPFEVPEPAEDLDTSSDGRAFSDYSTNSDSSDRGRMGAIYPFEIYEDEHDLGQASEDDDEFWLRDDWEKEEEGEEDQEGDDMELGDTDGIHVGHGQAFIVTQPAIDDVDHRFFPSEEDKDEEHLCSHALGHIHASSGIKRSRRDDIIHEVDWALIKIHDQRLQALNVVHGGGQFCQPPPPNREQQHPHHHHHHRPTAAAHSYPRHVLKANSLGGLHVHASGRTSGLQTGTIMPAMRMVKMPGRSFPSHSWQVRGNFGEGGDSGAWVIDNATGWVCGHVLAYSATSCVAYIAPMEVLLDDIAETLGARVELPVELPVEGEGGEVLRSDDGGLADGGDAVDAVAASSSARVRDGVCSPPLPTSPPALRRSELSGLSLEDGSREADASASASASSTSPSSSTTTATPTATATPSSSASASASASSSSSSAATAVDSGTTTTPLQKQKQKVVNPSLKRRSVGAPPRRVKGMGVGVGVGVGRGMTVAMGEKGMMELEEGGGRVRATC